MGYVYVTQGDVVGGAAGAAAAFYLLGHKSKWWVAGGFLAGVFVMRHFMPTVLPSIVFSTGAPKPS